MRVTAWRRSVNADLDVILRDLRQYVRLESLVPVRPNTWNAILHGSGESGDYCIKVCNDQSDGASQASDGPLFGAQVMSVLSQAGCRNVLPPLSWGGQVQLRCGGYWVQVFPWCPGLADGVCLEEGPQTRAATRAAARLLAKLHSVLRIAGPQLPAYEPSAPQAYPPATWARAETQIWKVSRSQVRKRGGSAKSIRALNVARDRGRELMASDPWYFSEDRQQEIVVHGDFRPENILLRRNGSHLVVDFDLAHRSCREDDVAYGAVCFSGHRWLMGPRNWRRCGEFIVAYERASDSVAISWQRMRVALLWCIIKSVSLSFKEEQVRGRLALLASLQEQLPYLESLCSPGGGADHS